VAGGSFQDTGYHDDYQYQIMMMSDEDNRGPAGGSSERGGNGRLLRLKNNYSVGPAETLSMGQEDRFVLLPPVPIPIASRVRSGGGQTHAAANGEGEMSGGHEAESGSGG